MAIVKCIECGHDVSTYADKCPNCGCPTSVIVETTSCVKDMFDVILENPGTEKLQVVRFIREISVPKRGLSEAIDIVENVPQTIISSVSKPEGQTIVAKLSEIGCVAKLKESHDNVDKNNAVDGANIKSTFLFTKDQPLRCPRCGSTAVTTTSRGHSLLTGFIGSNKTVNRCGKCGHTWKP